MNQQKNTADFLEQISCKEKYYCCESTSGQYCYITTNDEVHAEKLINAGGFIICHPSFFSSISSHQSEVEQLVPVVIRIQQERLDQARAYPIGICESALGKIY